MNASVACQLFASGRITPAHGIATTSIYPAAPLCLRQKTVPENSPSA
jgi:hypothetical protein